jgi:hypothetical protein
VPEQVKCSTPSASRASLTPRREARELVELFSELHVEVEAQAAAAEGALKLHLAVDLHLHQIGDEAALLDLGAALLDV